MIRSRSVGGLKKKRNIHFITYEYMNEEPLVVIRCLAYNHEPYIRQCLDGFVMQKTDKTTDIIREYAKKYPKIIKPILEKENQYSKHDGSIGRIIDNAIPDSVKYVAMCEGDDYWTDQLKLQKQVDFLEAHSDVVYSCHRYYTKNEFDHTFELTPNLYFDKNPDKEYFFFSREYPFVNDWITKTLTCVYRKDAIKPMPRFKYSRDVHFVYYILQNGKGVCHAFAGGVYRKNEGSTYGSLGLIKQIDINYKVYYELYKKTHDKIIKKVCVNLFLSQILRSKKIVLPRNTIEIEALFLYAPIKVIKKLSSCEKCF